jgi:Glycosyl transferase family 2
MWGEHPMSVDGAVPALTVVVPSVNGWSDLNGCLAALESERSNSSVEVLVVDRVGEDLQARVRNRYPWVKLLPAKPGTTIPQMRAMAFAAAAGEAVAVIEDHVLVPAGWCRAMLALQARGETVVGGGVENAATERLVDWAAFLCEYSQLIPPIASGPVEGITGNNTVYQRALLMRYADTWRAGRWENYLHDAFRRDGIVLYQHPEIVVGHKKHYSILEYLTQRYLYARSYAGARVSDQGSARKFLYGGAAFVLPVLLLSRVLGTIWGKGRYRGELLRSVPLLALFVTAWGAGEVVGYWFGPGDALEQVT